MDSSQFQPRLPLQRKSLFADAKKGASATDLRFLGDVFRAVMDRRDDNLLALLRRPGARHILRRGFQADSKNAVRVSFTQLCEEAKNMAALRCALEARIPGITLAECNTVVASSQGLTATSSFNLPASAADRRDSDGMAIALEFDPQHESFTRWFDMGTLHYCMLVTALQAAARDVAETALRCCAVFAAHVDLAPCLSDKLSDPLRRMFVIGRYDHLGNADLAEPMLRQYVAAGLFDIDAPMNNPNSDMGAKCSPLRAAIESGNASLSGTLIDLGCDLDAARSGFPDVIALASHQIGQVGAGRTDGQNEGASRTHGAVVEAVMRRRLKELHEGRAAAGAPEQRSGQTAPARRVKVL
jgi:hypothetical protein